MRQLKILKQVTNRDTKPLEKYFQEISKIGLITADEEVELALKIKKGDNRALDKLVSANLRFVVSVAKQYQGQGLKLSDLINEGNLGLVKAVKRFDDTWSQANVTTTVDGAGYYPQATRNFLMGVTLRF